MSSLLPKPLTAIFMGCCLCVGASAQSVGNDPRHVIDSLKLNEMHKQSERQRIIADFAKNQPVQTIQIDSITSSNAGRRVIQESSAINQATLQEAEVLVKNEKSGFLTNTADSLRNAAQPTANKVPIMLQTAATNLKFGSHNVVTSDGEETIRQIRSLTNGDKHATATMAMIREKQSAEALNFLGWLNETGAFGSGVNLAQAQDYYSKAAKFNYQPALYNLALGKAYGRFGAPSPQAALPDLANAMSIAKDDSGRVCGLASFLAHKVASPSVAVSYANECPSALGTFVLARYTDKYDFEEKLRHLRNSIGTGADDGFPALLDAATTHAKSTPDTNFLTCKFAVMNSYRLGPRPRNLRPIAEKCVDSKGVFKKASDFVLRDQAVAGVGAYVVGELANLKALRSSNKFRYSLPTPYLPFGQQEMNLFEKFLPAQASPKN